MRRKEDKMNKLYHEGARKRRILTLALAIIFTVAMSASVVFAAWPQYQGNLAHNGQITNGTPPTDSQALNVASKSLGGLISSESVMNTEDFVDARGDLHHYTYAYTLTGNGVLAKTNCEYPGQGTDYGEWTYSFVGAAGYQLGSPCLIESGTYAGVYVSVTDYFELLNNPQFDAPVTNWDATGGASFILAPTPDDPLHNNAILPDGGAIEQIFTYNGSGSRQATELFSQVKLQVSGNAAAVTYSILDLSRKPVVSYTEIPTSDAEWTNIEEYSSLELTSGTSYIIEVANVGDTVAVDHVDFSWQTSGIYKSSFAASSTTEEPTITDIMVSPNGGQANTPLVIDGQYLYYGTLSGTPNYYQIDLSATSPNNYKTFYSGNREYWAGATIVTINNAPYVVFGSDGGYLYVTAQGNNFGLTANEIALSPYVADPINHPPGNVRASVSIDGNYIYFTSQGGYIWQGEVATLLNNPDDPLNPPALTALVVNDDPEADYYPPSTSTPAISELGYVYAGYYAGFDEGGVVAVPKNNFTQGALFVGATEYIDPETGETFGLPVQASPIVWTDTGSELDYVYFTTNADEGRGYCFSFDGGSGLQEWAAGGNSYALQGFSAEEGYLVYGDDTGTLYVID
jgi:hypothetical protein